MKQGIVWCAGVVNFIAAAAALALAAAADGDLPQSEIKEPGVGPPLSAAAAAAGFQVPEGFHVSVFAAEPDVQNPIAMAWDRRGPALDRRKLHVCRRDQEDRPGAPRSGADL